MSIVAKVKCQNQTSVFLFGHLVRMIYWFDFFVFDNDLYLVFFAFMQCDRMIMYRMVRLHTVEYVQSSGSTASSAHCHVISTAVQKQINYSFCWTASILPVLVFSLVVQFQSEHYPVDGFFIFNCFKKPTHTDS